jgi:hypothetical protein
VNPSKRPRYNAPIEDRVLWAFVVMFRDLSYREQHRLSYIEEVCKKSSEQALGTLMFDTFERLHLPLRAFPHPFRLPSLEVWRKMNFDTGMFGGLCPASLPSVCSFSFISISVEMAPYKHRRRKTTHHHHWWHEIVQPRIHKTTRFTGRCG